MGKVKIVKVGDSYIPVQDKGFWFFNLTPASKISLLLIGCGLSILIGTALSAMGPCPFIPSSQQQNLESK